MSRPCCFVPHNPTDMHPPPSVNCRLPQTPRTPSAAASHYFDDVFTRQRRASLGGRSNSGFARSMTRSRSIGARSDWSNGTHAETADVDDDATSKSGRSWTIYREDGDPSSPAIPKHDDPDDPINRYVQDQLERIKTEEGREYAEELAAQTDGTGDEKGVVNGY